ncbi:MAG: hypothetical protein J5859_05775, partial [Clostridia bacterium]|nr:hypothetical protein [Clostridia bacterium]
MKKRYTGAVLLVVLFFLPLLSGTAEEGDAIYLDEHAVLADVGRSWLQGYSPAITGNRMKLVLPLRSRGSAGDISAELIIDEAVSPFKTQGMAATVQREAEGLWAARFNLSLFPDRVNGDYPCLVHVSGKGPSGEPLAADIPLLIHIQDGQPNREPLQIAVSDTGSDLRIGQEGLLKVDISNPSASVGFESLTLKISDPAGDILPAETDTLVLGYLMPGDSLAVSFPVTVLQSAKAAPHSLRFSFSGFSLGLAAETEVNLTVHIRQEIRLEHGGLKMPASVIAGDSVTLSLPLMNMGKADVVNTLATVALEGITESQSVLVGAISPGETKQAQLVLSVPKDALGEKSGTLTVSCEDEDGNPFTFDLPLSLIVEKPVQTDIPSSSETPLPELPLSTVILSAVCAALVLSL